MLQDTDQLAGAHAQGERAGRGGQGGNCAWPRAPDCTGPYEYSEWDGKPLGFSFACVLGFCLVLFCLVLFLFLSGV